MLRRFPQNRLNAEEKKLGEDEGREALRERYGVRGLIELAYAIASARIPPTVKRALGVAKSRSAVPVSM